MFWKQNFSEKNFMKNFISKFLQTFLSCYYKIMGKVFKEIKDLFYYLENFGTREEAPVFKFLLDI